MVLLLETVGIFIIPWSIINYMKTGRLSMYWVNTSNNGLVDKLIREGGAEIKISMGKLLKGKAS